VNGQAPPLSERYEQVQTLGRGGAGTVYLVRDRETGEQLALKRLLHADTDSLSRLKREFRSLADIHHPNLVKLYELGHDRHSAFFTMEYLEGADLKRYLEYEVQNDNGLAAPARIARVLAAFRQLASGVYALHHAGVLHRDLKPSNVMVANGRVVVLDFGLALEVGVAAATVTQDKAISGTPAYMAPEQIGGEHLGEPNDWYAFGAMLYEALSGKLPIEGRIMELLQRKRVADPVPLDALIPGLPPDVSALCMGLLRRAPDERPSGDRVMRVMEAHPHDAPRPATLNPQLTAATSWRAEVEAEPALCGRETELEALWAAFRRVQGGEFAVVHVSGESGAGKSRLVQQFTEEVERQGFVRGDAQPVVLRSRCYERETLPFKALDGAVSTARSYASTSCRPAPSVRF
jgi:serine/threonine protein kinase